jgi:glutamine synthetase
MSMGCFNLKTDESQIVELINAEGIETVRVVFVDQHGILRGKTLVATALKSAFENGVKVPSTLLLKDTSHRTAFPIWSGIGEVAGVTFSGANDVILRPNPKRFYQIPWSPQSALIFCSVEDQNRNEISISSDAILSTAQKALKEAGYVAIFGLEIEFQIFRTIDECLSHEKATMPATPVKTENLTQGYQYLTETKYSEVEEVLDELRRMSQALGLEPQSIEIEMGPSQFEFTFAAADPQTQAERFVLFRTMVKEVCFRRGMHASFMPKPALPNAAANGWHLHQSLITTSGNPAFMPNEEGLLSNEANGWIAGLLENAEACCLLTNPTVNSYKRFTPYQLAPNLIQWGRDNRGAMLRVLMHPNDPASRIENRVADTSANPFYAIAAQIVSGLDGITRGLKPPSATDTPYEGAEALPKNLYSAIEAFERSALFPKYFCDDFQSYMATLKRFEWDRYLMSISDWEQQEYFGLF